MSDPSEDEIKTVLGLEHSSLAIPDLDPFIFSYSHSKSKKQITILPTLHGQAGFCGLASKAISDLKPDVLALELPQELRDTLDAAIFRLPLATLVYSGELEMEGTRTLPPHPSSAYIVFPGEALYWGAFIANENAIPYEFIDTWKSNAYQTWMVNVDYATLASIGWNTFWANSTGLLAKHADNLVHLDRSITMANKIILLSENYNHVLVIIGAAHWPVVHYFLEKNGYIPKHQEIPLPPAEQYLREKKTKMIDKDPQRVWQMADIHPHSLYLVIPELPYYSWLLMEDPVAFDYIEAIRALYFEAEKKYQKKYDDHISPSSYRRMFQYLRNLGRLQYSVIPPLLNLLTAASGMGDGDYAFEVYETAINYAFPPSDEQRLDKMVKFTPDERQGNIIKFAFRRRYRRMQINRDENSNEFDLDPIPEELYDGQWEEIWDEWKDKGMQVSYPPEDVYIEQYMAFLRKKLVEILLEEQSSSIPFESSVEDGIDWRETVRHFHEQKIYVKRYPRKFFYIGALIVQFIEEPFVGDEYSHHQTWYAEHDQESHISIITTPPGDVLVGPGISRVKYAAIISQFPPIGVPYPIPKGDEDLKIRLIYTAMRMSLTRYIGFVAPRPPSAAHRHFAAMNGFRLVYLPMMQLTKSSLHRLRTMHILANRSFRDIAREYIGF